jgi:hypothetical protein
VPKRDRPQLIRVLFKCRFVFEVKKYGAASHAPKISGLSQNVGKKPADKSVLAFAGKIFKPFTVAGFSDLWGTQIFSGTPVG